MGEIKIKGTTKMGAFVLSGMFLLTSINPSYAAASDVVRTATEEALRLLTLQSDSTATSVLNNVEPLVSVTGITFSMPATSFISQCWGCKC